MNIKELVQNDLTSKVPYIGPAIGAIGVCKFSGKKIVQWCTPPELWIGGKCFMFVGGLISSVATGGNLLYWFRTDFF